MGKDTPLLDEEDDEEIKRPAPQISKKLIKKQEQERISKLKRKKV